MSASTPDQTRARNTQRRAATRQKIIEGAARALGEHGIDACSVQNILDAAGVSRRTYYQFFADKGEVLVAIFDRAVEHFHKRLRLALAGEGSAAERIGRAQSAYLDFASASGSLQRELAREAQRPDGPLLASRLALHQTMQELLCQSYEAAAGKPLDPLIARALILFNESLTSYVLSRPQASVQDIGRARRLLTETSQRLLHNPPL